MDSVNQKSNAPWILGVVGTAISIPQICYSVICASAYSEIAHDPMQTESQANTAAGLSPQQLVAVGVLVALGVIGVRNTGKRLSRRPRRYGGHFVGVKSNLGERKM